MNSTGEVSTLIKNLQEERQRAIEILTKSLHTKQDRIHAIEQENENLLREISLLKAENQRMKGEHSTKDEMIRDLREENMKMKQEFEVIEEQMGKYIVETKERIEFLEKQLASNQVKPQPLTQTQPPMTPAAGVGKAPPEEGMLSRRRPLLGNRNPGPLNLDMRTNPHSISATQRSNTPSHRAADASPFSLRSTSRIAQSPYAKSYAASMTATAEAQMAAKAAASSARRAYGGTIGGSFMNSRQFSTDSKSHHLYTPTRSPTQTEFIYPQYDTGKVLSHPSDRDMLRSQDTSDSLVIESDD